MTLLEFRELFVDITGRYDLVKNIESYEDDGADRYINMGLRKLDSMFTHSKSMGKAPLVLKPKQAVYEISNMLSIEGIQISADGSGGVSLDHIREEELESYSSEAADTGTPRYYCIYTNMRANGLGNSVTAIETLSIKISPAPDQSRKADVYGRITIPLEKDEDYNFWTVNYPETLISATMYMIERFHRNRSGMRDHMTAIREDLKELDNNAIESQLGSNTQMNDSFNSRPQGNEW